MGKHCDNKISFFKMMSQLEDLEMHAKIAFAEEYALEELRTKISRRMACKRVEEEG